MVQDVQRGVDQSPDDFSSGDAASGKTCRKIIEVGCVPPEYGGVAVHLQRLLQQLKKRQVSHLLFDVSGVEKSVEHVVCARWRQVIFRLPAIPPAVVHFHNFAPRNLIVYALLGLKHITILSFHNERFVDELQQTIGPIRKILVWMLNRLDVLIVDSAKCRQLLAPLIKNQDKIVVCPEFIAPSLPGKPAIPEAVATLRRKHKYLISSNAFRISFFQGEDLYGIDLLIELTAILIDKDGLDVAVVFLLPGSGHRQYYEKLNGRLEQLGIRDRFLFVTSPVDEACSIWRLSDVVIRATNTDGNSLTVQEALWCETPVIASDCVSRDPAVVQFKTRDLADLRAKTITVLTHLEKYRSRVEETRPVDNVEPLMAIYNRFLHRR